MQINSFQLTIDWQNNPGWNGIKRQYIAEDVMRLRSKVNIEYLIARHGALKLCYKLKSQSYVAALDALTDNQAIQKVATELEAIYLSGMQDLASCNSVNLHCSRMDSAL